MPKLRTLNIRNPPYTDGVIDEVPIDTQVRGIALTFIEELLFAGMSGQLSAANASCRGQPPQIDLLAIGSPYYDDVWEDVSDDTEVTPYNLYVLRTFSIEYCTTSQGRLTPVLTQIACGSKRPISDRYKNTSILNLIGYHKYLQQDNQGWDSY